MADATEILDVWAHVLPAEYLQRITALLQASHGSIRIDGYEGWPTEFPALTDLDARWKGVEGLEGYREVISLAVPPVEAFGEPSTCTELARAGNQQMAEIAQAHPDRVAGFVAAVALNDVEFSVDEIDRAVTELGAVGVQLYTTVNGRPIDDPEFAPIFAKAADLGCGVWLHPTRYKTQTDYRTEETSRFGLWWSIGWPYESTSAMARLAFSGLFRRHPDLAVITHHGGALVPHFPDRLVELAVDEAALSTEDPRTELMDQLRCFYPDTVMGTRAGLRSTIEFFGVERVVFATDAPYGPPDLVKKKIDFVRGMDLPEADLANVFVGNARRIIG